MCRRCVEDWVGCIYTTKQRRLHCSQWGLKMKANCSVHEAKFFKGAAEFGWLKGGTVENINRFSVNILM